MLPHILFAFPSSKVTLEQTPVLHVGLVSFGTSALLYLVCEELLLEAHERARRRRPASRRRRASFGINGGDVGRGARP